MTVAFRLVAWSLVALSLGGCVSMPKATELVEERRSGEIDEAMAVEALNDYITTINDALTDGDIDELASWTHRGCPCVELIAFIRDSFAEGGELIGARFTAKDVEVAEIRSRSREAELRARIAVSKYDVRSPDGLSVSTESATDFAATYTMRLEEGQWRVVDVQQNRR